MGATVDGGRCALSMDGSGYGMVVFGATVVAVVAVVIVLMVVVVVVELVVIVAVIATRKTNLQKYINVSFEIVTQAGDAWLPKYNALR